MSSSCDMNIKDELFGEGKDDEGWLWLIDIIIIYESSYITDHCWWVPLSNAEMSQAHMAVHLSYTLHTTVISETCILVSIFLAVSNLSVFFLLYWFWAGRGEGRLFTGLSCLLAIGHIFFHGQLLVSSLALTIQHVQSIFSLYWLVKQELLASSAGIHSLSTSGPNFRTRPERFVSLVSVKPQIYLTCIFKLTSSF
jgi:hypothetical protein